MHALLDTECHSSNKYVTIRTHDRHVLEFHYCIRVVNVCQATLLQHQSSIHATRARGYQRLFQLTRFNVIKYSQQFVHPVSVSGQLADFFVRIHDTTKSVTRSQQQTTVSDKVLSTRAGSAVGGILEKHWNGTQH